MPTGAKYMLIGTGNALGVCVANVTDNSLLDDPAREVCVCALLCHVRKTTNDERRTGLGVA